VSKNFIIFFHEKEGSTPLVSYLNNFENISIVKNSRSKASGWEPFDSYFCSALTTDRFRECLDLIYKERPLDLDRLNQVYLNGARVPLASFDAQVSVGFKMRFKSTMGVPLLHPNHPWRNSSALKVLDRGIKYAHHGRFKKTIFSLIQQLDLTCFVCVRRDLFRWALSIYHGDGAGRPGHLQFGLAKGKIVKDDIRRIYVEPGKFQRVIKRCRKEYAFKQSLVSQLRQLNVPVFPIYYSEFRKQPRRFFETFHKRLGLHLADHDYESAMSTGSKFKKVHQDDISSFVINHEEIINEFGDLRAAWND